MRVSTVSFLAVLAIMASQRHVGAFSPAFVKNTRSTARFVASASADTTTTDYATPERYTTNHPTNNVPPHIAALVGRGLHQRPDHPLGIIRAKIQDYFASLPETYRVFDAEDPIVTTQQCFDDLRIEPNHPGRSPSDTYYISDDTLLRTHTSAHQSQHLRDGYECFLCAGDVYRRDEIDASHYPAFHQLEGVKLFDPAQVEGAEKLSEEEWLESPACRMIAKDLKDVLEGLMDHLFGPVEKRWSTDYFPFTDPSFECEILYQGEWLEVLGCGVIHTQVLDMSGRADRRGWAFGLGLERLAMILFEIPDIRLFWTSDERFHKQFKEGKITTFQPYSKYPPCYKDIAFWLPEDYVENDFFEMARGVAGDLVEKIDMIDEFVHPKTNRASKCYRITYRSMDRSLTDEEVNEMQDGLRDKSSELGLEVR